jgi:hypothetical protein
VSQLGLLEKPTVQIRPWFGLRFLSLVEIAGVFCNFWRSLRQQWQADEFKFERNAMMAHLDHRTLLDAGIKETGYEQESFSPHSLTLATKYRILNR